MIFTSFDRESLSRRLSMLQKKEKNTLKKALKA